MTRITSLSSKGQIVLPVSIRKDLRLEEGAKFAVFSDGGNILLKPIAEPSVEEFRELAAKAQQWAEAVGMTEDDITAAIQKARDRHRQ